MNKIISRLKKANGQISALIKSIETNEDCEKTIIQFLAAKAAINKAFSELLKFKFNQCLKSKNDEELEKILNHISKL